MSDDDDRPGPPGQVYRLPAPSKPGATECVLKLRELLAQAEQGKYTGIYAIMLLPDNTWSFHQAAIHDTAVLGALRVSDQVVKTRIISTIKKI